MPIRQYSEVFLTENFVQRVWLFLIKLKEDKFLYFRQRLCAKKYLLARKLSANCLRAFSKMPKSLK